MPAVPSPTGRPAAVLWALMLAVGVVLADSSVVTLALPDIVGEFDASVGGVTWVLTAYNLVLAIAALPAAWLVRRSAGSTTAATVGAVLFAAACVGCAVAGSLEVLIGARVLQALGGALLVTAALDFLVHAAGSRRRGTALWAASGVAGTAIGPFAGGVLTEALAWQAIFAVQVPMVLLALPAIAALRGTTGTSAEPATDGAAADVGSATRGTSPDRPAASTKAAPVDRSEHATTVGPPLTGPEEEPTTVGPAAARLLQHETLVRPAGNPSEDATSVNPRTRPPAEPEALEPMPSARRQLADDATLLLLSAALTAALFLVVLLLIEGWRRTPITAALTVTVMPAVAILTRTLATRTAHEPHGSDTSIAGAILIAGGLGALGLLPGAELAWIVLPQVLLGAGLALTIEPLTARSLHAPDPIIASGRNLTVRHFGIVAGLALLTPIFLSGLDAAERPARDAVTSLVVDAPLPAAAKLSLAEGLTTALEQAGSRIPDLGPAFDRAAIDAADRPAAGALEARIDDQLDRAATHAFQDAFLVAAVLAAFAALVAAVATALDPGRRAGRA